MKGTYELRTSECCWSLVPLGMKRDDPCCLRHEEKREAHAPWRSNEKYDPSSDASTLFDIEVDPNGAIIPGEKP